MSVPPAPSPNFTKGIPDIPRPPDFAKVAHRVACLNRRKRREAAAARERHIAFLAEMKRITKIREAKDKARQKRWEKAEAKAEAKAEREAKREAIKYAKLMLHNADKDPEDSVLVHLRNLYLAKGKDW